MGRRRNTSHRHRHHRHSKRAEIAALRAGTAKVSTSQGHAPGSAKWRYEGMTAAERGYDHKWRKARAVYLKANPLCVFCLARGVTTASNTVDHITPHRGDADLFWDESNWQALCAACHNTTKKEIEGKGFSTGVDESGWPVDPAHPVNR